MVAAAQEHAEVDTVAAKHAADIVSTSARVELDLDAIGHATAEVLAEC